MAEPAIVFDHVWKKFRRGERHDSLRDLVPAIVKRAVYPRRSPTDLEEQEFWVLRDVSFEVMPGEALGIIGPNGAGKSTALKLLTRILRPTAGACRIVGRVGALIEVAAGFHADLTGRENIYLQGAIMGMQRAEITRRLDEIVAFSEIEAFIDTPVKRYSSGMNARLGFSIAAFLDPDVLLIDEVLAVGDLSFQQKCYARLADFRRSGAAIAFVSHNMQAVAMLCDRALLLKPNTPAIVREIGEATALYASTGVRSSDPRVSVTSFAFIPTDGSGDISRGVAPGTSLQVDMAIEALADLRRCCLGFEVVRADGQIMFNGGPTLDGMPPLDMLAGATLTASIRFRANLLRGTYRVNIHLVHEQRLWKAVVLTGLGTFVVHETTRVAGVAELEPTYRLGIAARGLSS